MTLLDAICECYNNKDLVREYDRLNGTSLGKKSVGINKMIDDACGYMFNEKEMRGFIDFVIECIWVPLKIRQTTEK